MNKYYEHGFIDELEKIAFSFPWNRKKRKRRKNKQEGWKEKLTSTITNNVKQYKLEAKIGKMFSKIIFK